MRLFCVGAWVLAHACAFQAQLRLGMAPPRGGGVLSVSTEGSQIFESLSEFSVHAGRVIVVKYGGHAMSDERAAESFAEDIVLMQKLGVRPVVVHGGGPQIGRMLSRPGQQKGAKFSTLKAHISARFHSFQLIFGRVIISPQVLVQ